MFTNYGSLFGPFWTIWSSLVQFNPLGSYLVHFVHFSPITSILVHYFTLVRFGPLRAIWSIQSNLVLFGQFRSNLVHLVHLGSFGSSQLGLFGSSQSIWVKCIINCLSNVNCNYMIIFYYHDNILKRVRI